MLYELVRVVYSEANNAIITGPRTISQIRAPDFLDDHLFRGYGSMDLIMIQEFTRIKLV